MHILNRDPNESDVREMLRWITVYQAEVQRIVNVLDYWRREVRP